MNDIDLERAIEFQQERKKRLMQKGIPANAGTMSVARFDGAVLNEGSNPLIKQRFAHVFQDRRAKAVLDAAQQRDRTNSFEKIPEKRIKGPSVKEEFKVEPRAFGAPNDATSRELRSIEDMFDPDKNRSTFIEPQGQRSVVGIPQYHNPSNQELSIDGMRMPEFDPRRQILSRAASRAQAHQELDYRSMAVGATTDQYQDYGQRDPRQVYMQQNQQSSNLDLSMIQELVEIMAEKKVKEILGSSSKNSNNNSDEVLDKNLVEIKMHKVNNLRDKSGNKIENIVKVNGKYYKMTLKEVKLHKK